MKKKIIFSVFALLTMVSVSAGAQQFHSTSAEIFLHSRGITPTPVVEYGAKHPDFGMKGQVYSSDLFKQRTRKGISYGILMGAKEGKVGGTPSYRTIPSICAYQDITTTSIESHQPRRSPSTPPPPTPPINEDDDDKILPLGDALWPLLMMAMAFAAVVYFRRKRA